MTIWNYPIEIGLIKNYFLGFK
ncbi:hypothetical protein BTTAP_60003 [Brochothrix thermosphacta]|nr:hypothetical protein BTEBP_40154 [Brochothrix thermosphacta]SPP30000.1 hypothetical protein BTTAP_60003 [Brochothrix thermosphacta]